jgi:hypothetical protein
MIAACRQIATTLQLDDMTEREFNQAIFAEASTTEPRGPSDAFTLEELLTISSSNVFKQWAWTTRSWLYSAIDALSA